MDSNTVTISSNSSSAISNITYIENSLVVSAGQSHDSAPQQPTKDGNVWTITLNADRNGTSDVAQSFNTIAGGSSHEYASSHGSMGASPSELNFYFGINLTIDTETIAVYLGQGNWGASQHNWWFGSSALIYVSYVIPPYNNQPALLGFRPQIMIDGTQCGVQGTGNSSFSLAT